MAFPLDRCLSQEVENTLCHHSHTDHFHYFQMTQKLQEPEISIRTTGGRMIVIPSTILRCLNPGEWLNDEVVNGYAQLVQDAAKPDIIVLDSFFCSKLVQGDQDAIRRYWQKVGLSLLFCSSVTNDYTESLQEE